MRLPFGAPKTPRYFAAAEYWLYMPHAKLPPQAALLNRMTKLNPFDPGGPPLIGAREALLFSDIRLHMGLVLRRKNVHVFRPDLFDDTVDIDPEALALLDGAEAFAKIRYVSESPLADARHLPFLVVMLEALGTLTRGEAAFDAVSGRLFRLEWLRQELAANPDGGRPELHLRTVWRRLDEGGIGATRGLVKLGLPELETPPSAADHRVLIESVLQAVGLALWEQPQWRPELEVRAFDDIFRVSLQPRRKAPALARIHRVHS